MLSWGGALIRITSEPKGVMGVICLSSMYHTATEGGMLRSLQFTWDVSRATIDFYLRNIHALIDIHPRRLKMIAEAIRDHPAPDDHMTRLQSMLRQDDQRPRLVLPRTWVQVGGPDSLFLPAPTTTAKASAPPHDSRFVGANAAIDTRENSRARGEACAARTAVSHRVHRSPHRRPDHLAQ